MKRMLPQECPVVFLYLTWLVYAGGLGYFVAKGELVLGTVWLVAYPVLLRGYVLVFPRISRWLGYGRVDDEAAGGTGPSSTRVVLYTAAGCPFCPIVERRLRELQARMAFDLDQVDVTLRPELLIRKGIRAVPVVEVGEQRITGHATSRELARLISEDGERR